MVDNGKPKCSIFIHFFLIEELLMLHLVFLAHVLAYLLIYIFYNTYER